MKINVKILFSKLSKKDCKLHTIYLICESLNYRSVFHDAETVINDSNVRVGRLKNKIWFVNTFVMWLTTFAFVSIGGVQQ